MFSASIVLAYLSTVSVAARPYLGFNLPIIDTQIVGGEEAQKGEFPHQVSLQYGTSISKLKHFCGGTILNSQWILTAGHCAQAVPSYAVLQVKAGKHFLDQVEDTEQAVDVVKMIVHEEYTGGVAPHDLALLKLKTPLRLTRSVAPVGLPNSDSLPGSPVMMTGWGRTSSSSSQLPNALQKMEVPVIDFESCKRAIERLTGPSPLHRTNVCTGPLTGGHSACNGDSGSPLTEIDESGESYVVGVASWAIMPCGTRGAPSVYVRVSAFNTWIQRVISEN